MAVVVALYLETFGYITHTRTHTHTHTITHTHTQSHTHTHKHEPAGGDTGETSLSR
jgi:hypothetical protein